MQGKGWVFKLGHVGKGDCAGKGWVFKLGHVGKGGRAGGNAGERLGVQAGTIGEGGIVQGKGWVFKLGHVGKGGRAGENAGERLGVQAGTCGEGGIVNGTAGQPAAGGRQCSRQADGRDGEERVSCQGPGAAGHCRDKGADRWAGGLLITYSTVGVGRAALCVSLQRSFVSLG